MKLNFAKKALRTIGWKTPEVESLPNTYFLDTSFSRQLDTEFIWVNHYILELL